MGIRYMLMVFRDRQFRVVDAALLYSAPVLILSLLQSRLACQVLIISIVRFMGFVADHRVVAVQQWLDRLL